MLSSESVLTSFVNGITVAADLTLGRCSDTRTRSAANGLSDGRLSVCGESGVLGVSLAAHAAQVVLIVVFAVAGGAKIVFASRFRETLYLSGLLPARLVPTVRWLVPIVEVSVAILLAVAPRQTFGPGLAAIALTSFSVAAWRVRRTSASVPCACFGSSESRFDVGVIARNAILLCYAILVALRARDAPGVLDDAGRPLLLLLTVALLTALPALAKSAASSWDAAGELADDAVVRHSRALARG